MVFSPQEVFNQINGRNVAAQSGQWLDKPSPATGEVLCRIARSGRADVDAAVAAAKAAQPAWAAMTPVARGALLHKLCNMLEQRGADMAAVVAAETGKSPGEAAGETGGAVALGRFYAGEGQRMYARTTTSGMPGRQAMTIREPMGVAGLIIAANTPIANVAWKAFPALICGNGVVLKAAEDTPATAWLFAEIAAQAGLPAGVLNVIQGLGPEAGEALVAHPDVAVLSFTGSTAVGRRIAEIGGRRLAKVSLELGGKNPLVVCDDADMANAVKWAALSAFSNAGQRCAAAGRIIVFEAVYDQFKDMLVRAAKAQKVGPNDGDDLGPVINRRQLDNMLAAVDQAAKEGAAVLCGGRRMQGPGYDGGFYMAPTVLENVDPEADIAQKELFGPITCLFKARDHEHALALANNSPYGLTSSIHTASLHRAQDFIRRAQCGVVGVNAGTYGSEPHMPFGGVKNSGNGSREPGSEALDIYSNLKDVYINFDSSKL